MPVWDFVSDSDRNSVLQRGSLGSWTGFGEELFTQPFNSLCILRTQEFYLALKQPLF